MTLAKPSNKPPRRRRPPWHRPLGWAGFGVAALVLVLNDVALLGVRSPLPGGHNELYLMLAVAVAAGGAWFVGLFDPV